jgi:hypothetical protein
MQFSWCFMRQVLLPVCDIIITEKDPIISRQGTAGKRKHIMLTTQQKFEIIRSVQALSNNLEHPIIHHMCDPMDRRLMELHCTNRDIFVHRDAYICCCATFLKHTCMSTCTHTHTHAHKMAHLIAINDTKLEPLHVHTMMTVMQTRYNSK